MFIRLKDKLINTDHIIMIERIDKGIRICMAHPVLNQVLIMKEPKAKVAFQIFAKALKAQKL